MTIDKLKKLELLKEKKRRIQNLPHLYGQKFYVWSREFYESTNKDTLLLCGNQVGKTSIQLRKMIRWATDKDLWPKLWPLAIKQGKTPNVFWFLITDYTTATALYYDKLVPEFLPRNGMVNDPVYGWKPHFKNRQIHMIEFNSGVKIYFHAYSKNAATLQSSTVYAIFTDEELPEGIHGELKFRTAAVDGYFSMVFTATLGQELWYRAFERIGEKDESFTQAKKIRATVYDCLEYEDGDTNTPWNHEKIEKLKLSCSTDNEIQKRVYGRFILDEGLVLSEFIPSVHFVKPFEISFDQWEVYGGVDVGSGGKSGHKGACVFLIVNEEHTEGYVFKGWKGNNRETTTSKDILDKYRKLRGSIEMNDQFYDWAAKDFHTFATRAGETFNKANKDHNTGWDLFNTLLKLRMLKFFDLDEIQPVRHEAGTLTHEKLKKKQHADDDFLDATRYIIASISWDISKVVEMYKHPEKKKIKVEKSELDYRREHAFGTSKDEEDYFADIEEELDEWAELYGN